MGRSVPYRFATPVELLVPPPGWIDASGALRPAQPIPVARPTDTSLQAERAMLLSRLRDEIRARHYSRRTEKAYAGWAGRFLCGLPREMRPGDADVAQVRQFLTQRALENCSASTQNQGFSGLLFLFREVMKKDLTGLDDIVRAKRPEHVPQVLARSEVAAIVARLRGTPWLMASLMYGSGLRLLDCCRLRVKDVDFERVELTVRAALTRQVSKLPAELRRTLTWDQGKEMADHVRFSTDTNMVVYFCDPHSPWQRGSSENTNGLLRQYFPAKADLSVHSAAHLNAVARKLNNRPRQTLGWMKPSEVFSRTVASID